ncbi:MAG: hypothetical protein PHT48_10405, partial [Dechloromonas sp.]|nr:hypothetical protein [Dechloromonas sp.]
TIAPGDSVRILAITPDLSLDEDDLDLFMDMVGSTCEVDYIDADGAAWVAVWWNCSEGTLTTQVGLAPQQMEKSAI